MYPGMAKTARDEGFDDIADWFEVRSEGISLSLSLCLSVCLCVFVFPEWYCGTQLSFCLVYVVAVGWSQTLAMAEKSHAGRFDRALKEVQSGKH